MKPARVYPVYPEQQRREFNRRGFAPILIVLVLGLLVSTVLGYLFIKSRVHPIDYNAEVITNKDVENLNSSFPSPSNETANWKTFEDRTLAVSMQYPSNWEVFSFGSEGGADLPNKPTAKVSFNNPVSDGTVFISLYPNPQNLSLNDYISMQIKKESDYEAANGQNAGNPYILPSGSQPSKLPNGLAANLKEKDDCDPFYCTTYIISRPKAFYKIYFFEQTDKEIVNKMLMSLKFTN